MIEYQQVLENYTLGGNYVRSFTRYKKVSQSSSQFRYYLSDSRWTDWKLAGTKWCRKKYNYQEYYGISQIDKKVDVSIHEISVELQSEMKVPFAFFAWEKEKMSKVWKMQIKKTIDRINPVDFIRVCRKAEKLMN